MLFYSLKKISGVALSSISTARFRKDSFCVCRVSFGILVHSAIYFRSSSVKTGSAGRDDARLSPANTPNPILNGSQDPFDTGKKKTTQRKKI